MDKEIQEDIQFLLKLEEDNFPAEQFYVYMNPKASVRIRRALLVISDSDKQVLINNLKAWEEPRQFWRNMLV